MAGKDPSMPFYVNDWFSSPVVIRMTLIERAAYFSLLGHCWMSGDCSLPEDEQELKEICGLDEPLAMGHPDDIADGNLSRCKATRWELVREQFIAHPSIRDRLTNAKLLACWTERQEFRAAKRASGAAGAAKRWSKSSKDQMTTEVASDSTPITSPMAKNASSSSSSSSKNSPSENRSPDDPVVQALVEAWNAIPDVVKVSKLTDKRLRALRARLKDPDFRENWRAGLQAVSRSEFLRGLIPGKSWRADFDWLLKPETVNGLIEGKWQGPAGQPGTRPVTGLATNGTAAGPLLAVTTEEATDPAAFDGWFERQWTFERTDRNRHDLHSVRCGVHRIFRKPETARDQLQARLATLANGRQLTDPPRAEDKQQAARELAQLAAGPARGDTPSESRELVPTGGAA